ncbi:MAG: hypothetical protein HY905_05425 [Deltaproteobacteria bacterium]|nr:hypothetical protein [Deltaproteobacteria bacterium]
MGLFDIFRKKAPAATDGPAVPRALEKNIKKLLNKYLQPEERWSAVQAVIADESDAAVDALLQRFTVYTEPSAVDDEEKEHIADALAGRGEKILPHLKKALRKQESISWLARIAGRILPRDGLRDLLLEVLAGFDTEYERNPERKIQVILALGDFPGEITAKGVVPFVEDVNETVRFQAASTLFAAGNDLAREPLLAAFLKEESVRVKTAILDGFLQTAWPVTGHRGEIEKALPKGWILDRAGTIKKRPKA